MYRFPRLPLLFLVVLLALSALACSISGGSPEEEGTAAATPDQAALVAQAVATITAQLPAATAPAIVSQGAPITTDLEADLIALYERVNPSVVHIFIYDEVDNLIGTGTGFLYDNEGHIVTNNHVVSGAARLEVAFPSGERRAAETVGTDVDSDLGVIRVADMPAGVQPLILGDSDNVRVGQFVVAIGNPFAEAGSLSLGIVSGLGRTLTSDRIAEGGGRYSLPQVIQTDAAINPGNSGGPLLNLRGEVVGVNSAIASTSGANTGVGFSIPVAALHQIVPALIERGAYAYPYLGVSFDDEVTLGEQTVYGIDQAEGAYVLAIAADGPAAQAGLIAANPTSGRGGDLIVAIDGRAVNNFQELNSYLVFHTQAGQTIQLTVVRDGGSTTMPLTLGTRP